MENKEGAEYTDSDRATVFSCGLAVKWAVNMHGIILVNSCKGMVFTLEYPDAAVWDLVSRGYPHEQIIRMLAAIMTLDVSESGRFLQGRLEEWIAQGFLIREASDG
jgi:hypothetical protein